MGQHRARHADLVPAHRKVHIRVLPDRKLGVTEMVCTAASTIHFTGNNIGRGATWLRAARIRLDVDRVDPENRAFKQSTRLVGPRITAPRSWPRSTPCWVTRNSRRRSTRRARPDGNVATGRLALENAAKLAGQSSTSEIVHHARGRRGSASLADVSMSW